MIGSLGTRFLRLSIPGSLRHWQRRGWCCHPPNDGFDFFLRTYSRVLQQRGGDHALGRKLYGCFVAAGIPDPQVALVQPVWSGMPIMYIMLS
jgi:hypothetical protein